MDKERQKTYPTGIHLSYWYSSLECPPKARLLSQLDACQWQL